MPGCQECRARRPVRLSLAGSIEELLTHVVVRPQASIGAVTAAASFIWVLCLSGPRYPGSTCGLASTAIGMDSGDESSVVILYIVPWHILPRHDLLEDNLSWNFPLTTYYPCVRCMS